MNMEAARTIRRARDARGWTAYELAKFAGIPEHRVFALERGRGRLDIRQALALANALGCTPEGIAPDLFANVGVRVES